MRDLQRPARTALPRLVRHRIHRRRRAPRRPPRHQAPCAVGAPPRLPRPPHFLEGDPPWNCPSPPALSCSHARLPSSSAPTAPRRTATPAGCVSSTPTAAPWNSPPTAPGPGPGSPSPRFCPNTGHRARDRGQGDHGHRAAHGRPHPSAAAARAHRRPGRAARAHRPQVATFQRAESALAGFLDRPRGGVAISEQPVRRPLGWTARCAVAWWHTLDGPSRAAAPFMADVLRRAGLATTEPHGSSYVFFAETPAEQPDTRFRIAPAAGAKGGTWSTISPAPACARTTTGSGPRGSPRARTARRMPPGAPSSRPWTCRDCRQI
ncbi:hypothetical protein BX281_0009 [Streptomyces sp. Ag82_O1-15]|nr:hypothetical protein BX281_0009 [Streptomyces sp. Ag82_O1-15]